jgi:plastocyanin
MKRNLILIALLSLSTMMAHATTYTVTTSGFTYTPDSIKAQVGDTIIFNVAFANHPTVEVDSATWAAKGGTALTGGFSATTGASMTVVLTKSGTHYYVCQFHVSSGMRGRILVRSKTTGLADEPETSKQVAVYPVPAMHTVHIAPVSSSAYTYTMTNLMGQTVLSDLSAATGIRTIDVAILPSGMYILSTTSVDGLTSSIPVVVKD